MPAAVDTRRNSTASQHRRRRSSRGPCRSTRFRSRLLARICPVIAPDHAYRCMTTSPATATASPPADDADRSSKTADPALADRPVPAQPEGSPSTLRPPAHDRRPDPHSARDMLPHGRRELTDRPDRADTNALAHAPFLEMLCGQGRKRRTWLKHTRTMSASAPVDAQKNVIRPPTHNLSVRPRENAGLDRLPQSRAGMSLSPASAPIGDVPRRKPLERAWRAGDARIPLRSACAAAASGRNSADCPASIRGPAKFAAKPADATTFDTTPSRRPIASHRGADAGRIVGRLPSQAAVDLIAGATLAAVARTASGQAPPDHPEQVAAAILRGLGVRGAEARRLVKVPLPAIHPRQFAARRGARELIQRPFIPAPLPERFHRPRLR